MTLILRYNDHNMTFRHLKTEAKKFFAPVNRIAS
jgi:hypothetical protein